MPVSSRKLVGMGGHSLVPIYRVGRGNDTGWILSPTSDAVVVEVQDIDGVVGLRSSEKDVSWFWYKEIVLEMGGIKTPCCHPDCA